MNFGRSFGIVMGLATAAAVAQIPQDFMRITPPLGQEGWVRTLMVFDDGAGPALFAGGRFGFVEGMGVASGPLARWTGSHWSGAGAPINGIVEALAVYDDGTGPSLYAGGNFTGTGTLEGARHLIRWNGAAWSAVPGNPTGAVLALAVHDDGGGPALYAAGEFSHVDGQTVGYVAKWDGAGWTALGAGVGPILPPGVAGYSASALASWDDGGGPGLFVAGHFWQAGGLTANGIARWRNGQWATLGSGLSGSLHDASALAVYAGALYVGGRFTAAGGTAALNIARWNGSAWSAVGAGFTSPVVFPDGQSLPSVETLAVHDDGTGPCLYAGGTLGLAGSVDVRGLGRWNGTSWSALGSGVATAVWPFPAVTALATFDAGGGPALVAGGHFETAGGIAASSLGLWRAGAWSAAGSGVQIGLEDFGYPMAPVTARAVDAGAGREELILTGPFHWVGTVPARHIARRTGGTWQAMGAGLPEAPADVVALSGQGAPQIFAGGTRLWRWDGNAWIDVSPPGANRIDCLAVFDAGSGLALHAAGAFELPYTMASGVARWTGGLWSVTEGPSLGEEAYFSTLVARTDANGPALYAAGRITNWSGYSHGFVWRLGVAGSTVYPYLFNPLPEFPYGNGTVDSLAFADTGPGARLHASGRFTNTLSPNLAVWDGAAWQALGAGTDVPGRLFVHDGGLGERLHRCVPDRGVDVWDGAAWQEVPGVPAGPAVAPATCDDGGGRDIVLAGRLSMQPDPRSYAVWLSRSCLDSSVGEGAGVPVPVLAIGLPGQASTARSAAIPLFQPSEIRILAPPGGPAPAAYALALLDGVPSAATLTPTIAGPLAMPVPAPGGSSWWLASSVGIPSGFTTIPAPLVIPIAGLGVPATVTVQGAIADAVSPMQISITNGIVVRIGP